MECGGLAFAEVGLVGGGHGKEAGTFNADDDLRSAGAVALRVGDGDGIGLRLLQGDGLGGLRVGVDHHVGRLPVEVEGTLRARVGGQCGAGTVENGRRRCRGGGHGHGIHGDGLRNLVGAMSVACRYGQSHLVGAGIGVSVVGVLSCSRLSIAKVPLVAADVLAARAGGGSAGELCGLPNANVGGSEAGMRLSIHHDGLSGSTIALVAHGDGASVGACHGQGAVGARGILQVRGETSRTSPTIRGTRLTVGNQVDGFAHAVRTAAIHQRRQDAAVGAARSSVRERDVTSRVGVVCNQKDVVLSRLCIVDMTVFRGGGAITTVHNVAACQLAACGFDVAERTPAVEVDVNLRAALHVDVQTAWLGYTHEIESGVGRSVKTT